jgi:hypothetical protein
LSDARQCSPIRNEQEKYVQKASFRVLFFSPKLRKQAILKIRSSISFARVDDSDNELLCLQKAYYYDIFSADGVRIEMSRIGIKRDRGKAVTAGEDTLTEGFLDTGRFSSKIGMMDDGATHTYEYLKQ